MIYDKYRGKYTGPQCVNKDQCITARQLALSLPVRKIVLVNITQDLGYLKVHVKWVPWGPAVTQKSIEQPFILICWHILKLRESFLSGIVTADEACIHYFELATKLVHRFM
jgi:hypothetical protein